MTFDRINQSFSKCLSIHHLFENTHLSHLSQDKFLDFLDEPKDSPRRKRKGLYGSYLLGTGEKRVKVILIDPRSQLDREKKNVLGEEQWTWLDKEIITDPTPVTILGTGRSYEESYVILPLILEGLIPFCYKDHRT